MYGPVITTVNYEASAALHQGRDRRFSAGAWPGHNTSSGGSASFVTSNSAAPAATAAAGFSAIALILLGDPSSSAGSRQKPGWDMLSRQWCSVLQAGLSAQ